MVFHKIIRNICPFDGKIPKDADWFIFQATSVTNLVTSTISRGSGRFVIILHVQDTPYAEFGVTNVMKLDTGRSIAGWKSIRTLEAHRGSKLKDGAYAALVPNELVRGEGRYGLFVLLRGDTIQIGKVQEKKTE